ncbi:MAG: hypothetical protein AB1657_00530 [Candidatus Micrarchaeota archaeon]
MATPAQKQAQRDLQLLVPKLTDQELARIARREEAEVRTEEAQLAGKFSEILDLARKHNGSVPDINTDKFSVSRAGNVVVLQTTDRRTGEEVLVTFNYSAGTVSAYSRAGKFTVG